MPLPFFADVVDADKDEVMERRTVKHLSPAPFWPSSLSQYDLNRKTHTHHKRGWSQDNRACAACVVLTDHRFSILHNNMCEL